MNGFDLLPHLTARAKESKYWLWLLNRLLGRVIPFNRPHGFALLELGDNRVRTTASYRRSNHNHLRGIHACAIATVAEFSAGFLLLSSLDAKQFRLIMSRLEINYIYQAKEQIISESSVEVGELRRDVVDPLQDLDSITITITSLVNDISGNEIAKARTTWQVKRWDQVKTVV